MCQMQVSGAETSNYIPQYLWDVITCPCPRYLLLAHKSTTDSAMMGSYGNDLGDSWQYTSDMPWWFHHPAQNSSLWCVCWERVQIKTWQVWQWYPWWLPVVMDFCWKIMLLWPSRLNTDQLLKSTRTLIIYYIFSLLNTTLFEASKP